MHSIVNALQWKQKLQLQFNEIRGAILWNNFHYFNKDNPYKLSWNNNNLYHYCSVIPLHCTGIKVYKSIQKHNCTLVFMFRKMTVFYFLFSDKLYNFIIRKHCIILMITNTNVIIHCQEICIIILYCSMYSSHDFELILKYCEGCPVSF